ncbi:Rna demethylase alkbh9b [Thalictrum thalictroides]|uniref:Rna demethylase alkbh9b n=1 Tax=Thalictrum thalictroides TaxID=46969 RepID=A0A7J6V0Y9_THATH|nr:Rna demethylase alkbh9b [Thalictrum thalictroides]
MKDPFIVKYQAPELKIAAEFLTTWLPFLTRDLCNNCTQSLSTRVLSLDPDCSSVEPESLQLKEIHCDDCDSDTNSLGSWKDTAIGSVPLVSTSTKPPTTTSNSNSPYVRLSWADMAQEEDELEDDDDHATDQQEEEVETNNKKPLVEQHQGTKLQNNSTLSREQREYLRFKNVERNKDFICLERVKGKIINILDGLELHTGVFSAAEQKRIVDYVYTLEDKGRKGELRERTFSAPQKWMRGKGRVTIQFGCCYNYAVLKDGNPPGILRDEHVDPIPQLFKVIIRRLIGWHILPPTCVPDSCIVNIYDEGDCIPPHIDNHDFVRPFCTVSFLSECNILFGSTLKAVGPGNFSGAVAIPLPVGFVLLLLGNGIVFTVFGLTLHFPAKSLTF